MAQPPKITWSMDSTSLDVPAGETVEAQLSFHADQTLSGVTIAAVPELARFVTIEPSVTGKVPAGTRVELRLRAAIPEGTPLGEYDGTIHVRDGKQTLARPLPLKIRVVAERPTWRSKGVVTLDGISPSTFNARNATARFLLTGATFSQVAGEVLVTLNGHPAQIVAGASEVSAALSLQDGVNRLSLQAIDDAGGLLFFATTLWAGSETLVVRVLDERGQPAAASVTIKAGDDQRISATTAAVAGVATFTSVTGRTLLVEARGEANRFGHTATHGGAGTVTLALRAFDAPSPIANNDFSQGTSGWNIGNVPVRLVPHVDPTASAVVRTASTDRPAPPPDREAAWRELRERQRRQTAAAAATTGDDVDMLVPTEGEGPQTVSRSFQTSPATKSVVVRHRFITSEVPGGFFGTEFNDSFSVTIRSEAAGGVATLSQTMNGLGLEAFNYDTGETREWFEARLPVDREGDVVQIDATVSNVGDGLYDSQLVIDLVKEKRVEIGPLEAVVCGGTGTVVVTMPEKEPPVTLELTSNGEGEATFAGGDTTMTITETTTVTINGVTISSSSGDIRLTATSEGEELDQREFTVIWVELEIRNSGTVSHDNDAAWKYVDMMGTDQLGFVVLGAKLNYNLYTCAIEAVGTVKPDDFTGEIIPFRFLVDGGHYQDQKSFKDVVPGADISRYLIDTDPRPEGHVYDIDAPGDRAHGHAVGIVYRQRLNMRQWFVYGDQIVSDIKPWFTRTSFKRIEGRVYEPVYDAPGDNQCGEGVTAITWNLQ
jgi:hypothetical protein